jgi:hypothetical protein
MSLSRVICAMAGAAMLAMASSAGAQFWAGYPAYGGYAWGGYPTALTTAAAIGAVNQSRIAGQEAAMGQNYMVQSGIRSTLTSQAQSRTSDIASQRQEMRDWWFQNQQQQMAARRPYEYGGGAAVAGYRGGTAAGMVDLGSQAAMDIIKWPTALQDRAFASRRALIEAPYRRSPPAISTPTPDDYRTMVGTIEQMKAILECLLNEGGMVTEDYQQAKTFLDKIDAQARQRAAAAAAPPPGETLWAMQLDFVRFYQ